MFIFTFFFISITNIASANLFDHAVKNYVAHISNQSPEKAKIAELITRAAHLIKEIEKEDNAANNFDNKDNADIECEQKTFDEFRLICAKNGAPFLEKINPKTAVGMAYLIKLFTSPTSNKEVLKKRQALIKFFIENPDIVEKIEHLLHNITNEESTLIEPYKKYSLNDIPKLTTHLLWSSFCSFLSVIRLKYFVFEGYKGEMLGTQKLLHSFTDKKNSNFVKDWTNLFTFADTKTFKQIFNETPYHISFFLISVCLPILVMNAIVWKEFLQYKVIKPLIKNSLIDRLFQAYELSQRINNQKSFLNIIETVKQIQPYIPYSFSNIDEGFLKKINLNNSLDNNQNYCINEDGNLVPIGKNFFKEEQISTLLHPHTAFLKNLYRTVGFLDAYSALAQFYKKHNGQFAQYNDAIYPSIEIKGGKHPNITDTAQAIANDFVHTPSFEKPVIVCSGKNGSGKSFNTKTIFLTAWLAQTIGFTLTEQPIIITPFSLFKIHANIADSDHYSKFETEKNELAKLFEKITHLQKNNKKSLILFDEPLSSTSSTIAEPILNTFIAMLNTNKKTLSFIITHLHPILANKDTRQISIKVTKNDDGTFSSTRKFQEGPSYDNDAKDMIAQALHPTLQSLFLNNYETALQKMKALNKSFETSTNANNSI